MTTDDEVQPIVPCARCGEHMEKGYRYKVEVGARNETTLERWCGSCVRQASCKCGECGTRYPTEQIDDHLIRFYGGSYCYLNDCWTLSLRQCDCGVFTYLNDIFCRSCNRDVEGNLRRCQCGAGSTSSPIHEYSCVPNLVFHGSSDKNLWFGFELETQVSRTVIGDAALFAMTRLQEPEIAQLKHDSSIGGGFEIVTQPHTYEAYRNDSDVLWDTIDRLRQDYEARSWDAGTCGLHIHISRTGFNNGAHQHRFIEFVYRNSEMMMKFGGRKSSYARFNDVWGFDEYDKPVFTLEAKGGDDLDGGDKYTAVNTNKEATLELRFMRGTMNPSGVKSSLGLAHAMVEYTRDIPILGVGVDWYNWEDFAVWCTIRRKLYPELLDRMPSIKAVNLKAIEHQIIDA